MKAESLSKAGQVMILDDAGESYDDADHALRVFLKRCRTPATEKAYAKDLEQFFGAATEMLQATRASGGGFIPLGELVREIRTEHVLTWQRVLKDSWGLQASTVNRKTSVLNRYLEFLVLLQIIPVNVAHREFINRYKEHKWTPRLGLSQEETARLIHACRKDQKSKKELSRKIAFRDEALISLLYGTLIRRGEASNCCWGDLRRESKVSVLTLKETKTGPQQEVPVADPVMEALRKYFEAVGPHAWIRAGHRIEEQEDWPIFIGLRAPHEGKRFSSCGINRRIKARAKQAGLPADKISAHLMRHTGVTHLLDDGVPIRDVGRLARHQKPDTTSLYDRKRMDLQSGPAQTLGGFLKNFVHP